MSSGGAERNASILANYFSNNNKVSILTLQKYKKSFYKIDKKIKIHNLNLIKNNNNLVSKFINFIKRLYFINLQLRRDKPEILISFLETTNITVLIASFFVGSIKKRIISDRNDPRRSDRPFLIFLLKFIFYRFADHIVLQTKKIRENYNYLKKKRIEIIPNTISKNLYFKKKYNFSKNFKLISVGRLEYQKGYDILIKSLKELKKTRSDFICHIFGVGSEKHRIIKNIRKFDLQNNIFLKGVKKDILKYYKNYDLFVLSSRFEGFPNSLLEALASGLVSISSDCDYGPKEIVSNNFDGLLFKNENHLDLCRKIRYLYFNKKKLNQFSKRSQQKFDIKKYNSSKIKKWTKLVKIN